MGAAAWAGALSLLVAITIFKFPDEWKGILKAISGLLNKTKKVGLTGIEAQENPPPPNPDERQDANEFFRSFDNPMLREQEDLIVRDLVAKGLNAPADRERAL